MKSSAAVAVILVILLIAGGIFYFRDTDGPVLSLTPQSGAVSANRPLSLHLEDAQSGLKRLTVTALQGERSSELLSRTYPAGTTAADETVSLEGASLQDGPLELRVTAGDGSVYHFGAGNTTEEAFSFTFDNRAPLISVLSSAHNLNRGGAAVVTYSLSEEAARTGVTVGERFFPGYRLASGTYVAFFAFPWDMSLDQFTPRLTAVDQAGNERQAGFYYHVNPRSFPRDRINISDQFLATVMPSFETAFSDAPTPLDLFLRVNRDLRAANVATIRELGNHTATEPLWQGEFLRQPNAAPRGNFAEGRTYFYQGKEIDRQTHLGIDLASLAQAPVPAANAGTVVFADALGIYGNCVVLDHGLGLQSLYGHLSSIAVHPGETVAKGQTIGRTGATGLAGGDHLHFEVLIAGVSVNPLEWWDPNWIRNNVSGKLEEALRQGK